MSLELLPGKHPLQAFSHTRPVTGFIRVWPACPTANRLSQTWLPEAGSVYLWLVWIWSSDPLSFTLQGVPGHGWCLAALAWQKPLKTSPAREMEAGFSHTCPHSRDRAPQHPRPHHWDWGDPAHLQALLWERIPVSPISQGGWSHLGMPLVTHSSSGTTGIRGGPRSQRRPVTPLAEAEKLKSFSSLGWKGGKPTGYSHQELVKAGWL